MKKKKKCLFLRHGVPLRFIVVSVLLVAMAISFALVYCQYKVAESYDEMKQAVQNYIDCQNSAYRLQECIDFLSNHAKSFVVTGNAEPVILYANELQVQKNREKSYEDISSRLEEDERVLKHLDNAITLSDLLIEKETYAMRLAILAWGKDIRQFPALIQSTALKDEDLKLEREAQLLKARDMVFGSSYESMKGQTDTRISLCVEALITAMLERQNASADRLLNILFTQRHYIYGMVFSLLLEAFVIFFLVIIPLHRQVRRIAKEQLLDERGTSELRFLAKTYNRMFEQMKKTKEDLNYSATHDPLTGLNNRSVFDKFRDYWQNEPIALLLVDVDSFKSVNDTYGHDIGDKVLIRVAKVLTHSFRKDDIVCRIGGDEFAVIILDTNSDMEAVLRSKIEKAASILSVEEDDIPPVTLSVGAAFSDRKMEDEDLYKIADKALYKVKENGRDGCVFTV